MTDFLPLDAPVELAGLLRAEEQALLSSAREELACPIALIDRAGRAVLGEAPPAPVRDAEPGPEPMRFETERGRYLCGAVYHDGDRLALLCCGPLKEGEAGKGRYLLRLSDALVQGALRRTLAARVHVASVEESYCELQEKNRRLEQALERMRELDRVKANFLATVSHELRTPLTSVIGYSEMLMEGLAGPLNEEQREYLRTVMDKGEQLLHLITGILDISRIEASGVQLQRGPVDIEGLVRDVVSTVTPQARRKRLQVQMDLAQGLPVLQGDADKLRQSLLNLVGNAIKFTSEGEVRITAEVDQGPGGAAQVHLRVADTGIGIPSHLHEKIFDPFFQVDNSSTREYEGTGLGLSIVRKFIEAHGGHVWVEDRVPRGVVFHLTLPLQA
jgi:signal transduction histidine kinase